MRRQLSMILLGVLLGGGSLIAAPDRLADLAAAHDLFGLRDALTDNAIQVSPLEQAYYSALVAGTFTPGPESEEAAQRLLRGPLPSGWRRNLLEVRMDVDLRVADYARALADAVALANLREPGDPPDVGAEAANTAALLTPLRGYPAQTGTVMQGHIDLHADKAGGRCAKVLIDGQKRCYAFDSGANFSLLIQSEAKALGLRILPTDAQVGTATGSTVHADIAVASDVLIGGSHLRDVVFLVVPDAAMTFPGVRIPGLLGFPILRGLGKVRFNADHSIDVLLPDEGKPVANVALDGQQPLVQLVVSGQAYLCALDTGASRTVFYKPFYMQRHVWLERSGYHHMVHLGGAGGIRALEAVRIPELAVELAGKTRTLHSVDVFVHDVRPDQPYLACNIGLDLLESGRAYTLDFHGQVLSLE